jgi:drug/metabolite transporter (DMT)-like permease
LIFALLSGIFPHLLLYKGLQKIQASVAGVILLLEPISATILAAIFFNQLITFNIIMGGILILISNYLVIKGDNK